MRWVREHLCLWSVSGAPRNETWHVDDKCLRDTKVCNPEPSSSWATRVRVKKCDHAVQRVRDVPVTMAANSATCPTVGRNNPGRLRGSLGRLGNHRRRTCVRWSQTTRHQRGTPPTKGKCPTCWRPGRTSRRLLGGPSLATPVPCKWRRLSTLCARPHSLSCSRTTKQCWTPHRWCERRTTEGTCSCHMSALGKLLRKTVSESRPKAFAHWPRQLWSKLGTALPVSGASPLTLSRVPGAGFAEHWALKPAPSSHEWWSLQNYLRVRWVWWSCGSGQSGVVAALFFLILAASPWRHTLVLGKPWRISSTANETHCNKKNHLNIYDELHQLQSDVPPRIAWEECHFLYWCGEIGSATSSPD